MIFLLILSYTYYNLQVNRYNVCCIVFPRSCMFFDELNVNCVCRGVRGQKGVGGNVAFLAVRLKGFGRFGGCVGVLELRTVAFGDECLWIAPIAMLK